MGSIAPILASIALLAILLALSFVAYVRYRSLVVAERDRRDARIGSLGDTPRDAEADAGGGANPTTKAEIKLKNAGMRISARQFASIRIGLLALAFLAGLATGLGVAGTAVAIIVAAVAPEAYLRYRISKRRLLFSEQFCAALPMIAENMRAGLTIESSIRNVTSYMDDPLREEFRRVCYDLSYNIPLSDALDSLAVRTGDKDVKRLGAIVSVLKEGGGNLSELLDIEAKHIRTRFRMRGHIRSITTSGRMQGIVVGCVPFAMLVALSAINPEMYAGFFFADPLGMALLAIVIACEAVGLIAMLRICNIDMD